MTTDLYAAIKEYRGSHSIKETVVKFRVSVSTVQKVMGNRYRAVDGERRMMEVCEYGENCFECPLADCKTPASAPVNRLQTDKEYMQW